jgi:hypothetical protein
MEPPLYLTPLPIQESTRTYVRDRASCLRLLAVFGSPLLAVRVIHFRSFGGTAGETPSMQFDPPSAVFSTGPEHYIYQLFYRTNQHHSRHSSIFIVHATCKSR